MPFVFPSSLLPILSFIPLFHGKETAYTLAGLTGLLTFLRLLLAFTSPSKPRRPPGPDRLPLLGNLHNFPQSGWLDAFCAWQKRFGAFFLPPTFFSLVLASSKKPHVSLARSRQYRLCLCPRRPCRRSQFLQVCRRSPHQAWRHIQQPA